MINRGKPSNLRIEIVEQSVRHIDALDRARISCRLLFRTLEGDPVANSAFIVRDVGGKDGIFQGDTDIDGEADIEFWLDISAGIRRKLEFIFTLMQNSRAEKTFMLKDKRDARMQNNIREVLGRRRLGRDLHALLQDIDDDKICRFLSKYGGDIPKTTMDIITGLIKRARKMKENESDN